MVQTLKDVNMKVLYAVPWIEVEYNWGERPEGYQIYDDLERCINETRKSSANGNYSSGDGYFGPERPLHYFETADEIPGPFPKFVNKIKFKSDPISI